MENQHENKALLRTFVTLLDSLRPHLSLRHIDVLCRGTEGLITLIKLLSDGTECQTSSEEKKNNEMLTDNISLKDIPEYLVKFLKEALGIVNRFFKDRREFSLQYSRDMEVNQELQVNKINQTVFIYYSFLYNVREFLWLPVFLYANFFRVSPIAFLVGLVLDIGWYC